MLYRSYELIFTIHNFLEGSSYIAIALVGYNLYIYINRFHKIEGRYTIASDYNDVKHLIIYYYLYSLTGISPLSLKYSSSLIKIS